MESQVPEARGSRLPEIGITLEKGATLKPRSPAARQLFLMLWLISVLQAVQRRDGRVPGKPVSQSPAPGHQDRGT